MVAVGLVSPMTALFAVRSSFMRSWALCGREGVSMPMYPNDLGPFMPAGHVAFGIRFLQTCVLGRACWLCCLRPTLKIVRGLLTVLVNSRPCLSASADVSGAIVLNGAKRLFNTVLEC
jgi:hypothetical protein